MCCCTSPEDVSPKRVFRKFLGFWGPRCIVRASKCSSGIFPRIKFPGHSWAFGIHNALWASKCLSGTFPRIEFPGHSWASGVPNVLCGLRSVHPGRVPKSSFPGVLGLLGPQCIVRASKCSSRAFPRIEFPEHSWISGSPNVLYMFPRIEFLGHSWASGVPNVLCGRRCVHPGRFPRIEFPAHSWASGVPDLRYGPRSIFPGRFPESSFPGILGFLESTMCCTGFEMFIRDVSRNRVARAFLGFWCPQCAVRVSKCSSGRFPESSFPGILGLLGSPMCCAGFEVFIRDVSPNQVSRAILHF
jgi:hypothetical protein